jgi:hypothetical protein
MATLARSVASLRITGDSLEPDEITRLLGHPPTKSQTKGQELHGSSGRTRVAKFGGWWLEAQEAIPADLDDQARELLERLTADLSVWLDVSSRFKVDLFCGWFMQAQNEGIGIAATTLRALGERGIELSLDIYGGAADA